MEFLGINGWEFVIIVVLALVLIGPERLPEYAGKLGAFVRQTREFAVGAREQLRDQMGPEFDDIDWKAYDPRQYDPRRIVREALADDGDLTRPAGSSGTGATAASQHPAPTGMSDTGLAAPVAAGVAGSGSAGSDAAGSGAAGSGAAGAPATYGMPVYRPYDPSQPTAYDPDAT